MVMWYRTGFFHWLDEEQAAGAWDDDDVTSFRERDIAFVQKGCTSKLFVDSRKQVRAERRWQRKEMPS